MSITALDDSQIGGELKSISVDWGVDGIYSTTSSTFAQLGFNILVGNPAQYAEGATQITAILIAECDAVSGTTGEIDLYNYSDSVQIDGSATGFDDLGIGVWGTISTPEINITPGKSYRVRVRRVTGSGQSAVYIRSATLLLKFS